MSIFDKTIFAVLNNKIVFKVFKRTKKKTKLKIITVKLRDP